MKQKFWIFKNSYLKNNSSTTIWIKSQSTLLNFLCNPGVKIEKEKIENLVSTYVSQQNKPAWTVVVVDYRKGK